MKLAVHVLVALFVALLSSVVWDNGNAGNRQSLPRRRVFGFGRIIPLYAGLAAALFPLVLFEQSFQRPVPFVSVCLLELLAVLAFLYVLSFRICIKDGSVATRCFFPPERNPRRRPDHDYEEPPSRRICVGLERKAYRGAERTSRH